MRNPNDIIINGKQLSDILESHKKWLLSKEEGERADLRAADLRAANLRDADLRAADLRAANLSAANLRYANLSAADLRYANLRAANLRAANLSAANLSAANLSAAENSEFAAAIVSIVPDGDIIGETRKIAGVTATYYKESAEIDYQAAAEAAKAPAEIIEAHTTIKPVVRWKEVCEEVGATLDGFGTVKPARVVVK